MSSAFPRPTISAANGCAIIAAFPLNRLHNRMRPIDADRVYTSTGQVALTILLQNGDPMLIVELTRLLLQWLWLQLVDKTLCSIICGGSYAISHQGDTRTKYMVHGTKKITRNIFEISRSYHVLHHHINTLLIKQINN